MNLAKELKISLLVVTLCYVLLGLVLLFCPQFTVTMLCYAVGGICVVYGVSRAVAYVLRGENWDEPYRFDLVIGMVFVGGGLYAILQSGVVAGFLGTLMGLAVCVDSLVKLQTAIDLKRLGSRVWVSVLLLAMLTGALGVLLFFYKGTGILSVLQFLGVCLVIDGCVNVWSFTFLGMNLFRLRKAKQAQAAADAAAQADAFAPDNEVHSDVLTAFGALKRKAAPADFAWSSNGEVALSTPAATMEEPSQAAVLLLKPTDEELGGVHSLEVSSAPENHAAPETLETNERIEASQAPKAPEIPAAKEVP